MLLERMTPFSTYQTTIMADIKFWCLVIDHDHCPTFGEPFPVTVRHDDTIHDLKVKIMGTSGLPDLHRFTTANRIEIWMYFSSESGSKLSAKDCFHQTGRIICEVEFSESDDELRDVCHLGAARKVIDLELEEDEILLALVPSSESG
ncbi:hypothetical protein EDB92DRAFT_1818905 [Lactarius akahatsu]|uniref:Uncharacterized protein n=1 Tax=Lactarius akahatsu TaxID=416441 RepID=A0AAD4L8V0_9AGAM|nr:hypothetical protein EDB92DRAFT_1818905 [Lactarius akahatsu]